MELQDADLRDLIIEVHRRNSECLICYKPFGEENPEFSWKGCSLFCETMAKEFSNVIDYEGEEVEADEE